jgi:hypothetical protein
MSASDVIAQKSDQENTRSQKAGPCDTSSFPGKFLRYFTKIYTFIYIRAKCTRADVQVGRMFTFDISFGSISGHA